MDTVTLNFEYTKRDYIKALRQQMYSKRSQRMSLIVLPVLLVIAVVLIVLSLSSGGGYDSTDTLLIVAVVFFLFIYIGTPYLSWRLAKKTFGKCFMEISPEGVYAQTPAASSNADWSAYKEYWESREFLFMIQFNGKFHIIPKRALVPGQLESLRRIVSGAIPYGEKRVRFKG